MSRTISGRMAADTNHKLMAASSARSSSAIDRTFIAAIVSRIGGIPKRRRVAVSRWFARRGSGTIR